MPKDKSPLERYQSIHQTFLKRQGTASLVKLEELSKTLHISLRKLNDDIKYMKAQGAPLEYVAAGRGWRYADGQKFEVVGDLFLGSEEAQHIQMALEMLQKIHGPDLAKSTLPALFHKIYRASRRWTRPEGFQKHIYFDPVSRYLGSTHIDFFLHCIEAMRRVEFQYQAYHADAPKTVVFDPWFLRHYDRRWYVGGFSHDPNEQFVRTFPLERIVGKPQHQGFYHDKPPQYDAQTYWQNIYGITVPPEGKVEEVLLAFTTLQGKYFLGTPFFEPYEVVEDGAERLVVCLRLMPNIDLVRKLASYGPGVRVLAPASLAEDLRTLHQEALAQYQVV